MKLLETIYFSLAVASLMIGIHRTISDNSITENYSIFMFSIGFFLLFVMRKRKNKNLKDN